MITGAHYHNNITVLTICWFDDGTYKEKYIEGEDMLFALAELHAEESQEGSGRAILRLIGGGE